MPPDQPHWQEYEAPGQKSGGAPEPETPEPVSEVPAPFVPYGNADVPGPTHTVPGSGFSFGGSGVVVSRVGSRAGMVGAIVGVAAAVVGVGVAIFAASGGIDIGNPVSKPDTFSQEGIDELTKDLDEDLGTTEVYELSIFDDYIIVESPAPSGGDHYDSYYWDGSLDDWSKGTEDSPLFDISAVDGSLLSGLCDKADRLVKGGKGCYVLVSGDPSGPSFYSAYTSNDYGEGGYLTFDKAGKQTNRYTW